MKFLNGIATPQASTASGLLQIPPITTAQIADEAITSAKIADGTIVDADISLNANINPSKIDWDLLTPGTVNATLPEGIIFETNRANDWNTEQTSNYYNGFFNAIYIPYPIYVNYISYYIAQSSTNTDKVNVALYNLNYNKVLETGLQSSQRGSYKISIPTKSLSPGQYFILMKCSNPYVRFYTDYTMMAAINPLRGFYNTGRNDAVMPSVISLSNIDSDNCGQPYIVLSKY